MEDNPYLGLMDRRMRFRVCSISASFSRTSRDAMRASAGMEVEFDTKAVLLCVFASDMAHNTGNVRQQHRRSRIQAEIESQPLPQTVGLGRNETHSELIEIHPVDDLRSRKARQQPRGLHRHIEVAVAVTVRPAPFTLRSCFASFDTHSLPPNTCLESFVRPFAGKQY